MLLPIFESPVTSSVTALMLLEIDTPVPVVLIVCVPILILEPLNHKSFHTIPSAPKSYTPFALGIKLPSIDPTFNEPVMLAFALPVVRSIPTNKSLSIFAYPGVIKLPTFAVPVTFAVLRTVKY